MKLHAYKKVMILPLSCSSSLPNNSCLQSRASSSNNIHKNLTPSHYSYTIRMQLSNILSVASGLALTHAAPLTGRTSIAGAEIVFHGAADAQYSLTVPLDGTLTYTNNALSISSVSSSSINIASECVLNTVDYPPALVSGPPGTWTVGPPQTVTSISCTSGYTPPTPPPSSIVIEFQGADPVNGAFYDITIPLDGSVVKTNNVLSISTLVSSFDALASNCVFKFVDGSATLARLAADKWAVGPPQTITEVYCHA